MGGERHEPWPEQLASHALTLALEQSLPLKPASHTQVPSGAHDPRPLQAFGQLEPSVSSHRNPL